MWGDKKTEEKNPEEKSVEQSKEQVNELVTQLRASFEESLKPLRDKVESYETRFSTLEENTKKPAPKVENAEIPSVIDNEDGAFAARLGPVLVQTALLNARITESQVLTEVAAKGWAEYIPQIREKFEKFTNIQTKASTEYGAYCWNVVNMIIGENALKNGLRRDTTKQSFFIEPAGSSSDQPGSNLSRLQEEASDGRVDILKKSGGDIATWARKMGIDPEVLAKSEA